MAKSRGSNWQKLAVRACLVSAIVVASATMQPLMAQTPTADVLGLVTDQSGAVIPEAHIIVKNLDTGETRTVDSAANGEYTLNALKVGRYSVTVASSTFKTFEVAQLDLSSGDRARVDAHMELGAANETVTVTDSVSDLKTDSSGVGDTIVAKSVQDLPLNGRNFVQLVQVTAGVNAAQPTSVQNGNRNVDRRSSNAYSANGQSELFNNNLIDGLDNNERNAGFIIVRPSIEGIQEISVLTNGYSAEIGRAAGAVVNVVTKSGSNSFHGSLFEYVRNDIFDARQYFARSGQKPEFRQNQFGGSFGGPIFRNKTFFFLDVEALRIRNSQTQLLTTPTAYQEAHPGDFSDIGGPVVAMPNINPVGLAYFKLYPTPNLPGTVNNYQGSSKISQNAITYDARVDHDFSAKDHMFARYSYSPTTSVTPSAFPTVNGIQPGGVLNALSGTSRTTVQNAQLDYTHIFSPSVLSQIKAGYVRYDSAATALNDGKNLSQALGLQNVNLPNVPGTSGLSLFYPLGYSPLGDALFLPYSNINNNYQLNGSLTYTRGAQTIKTGFSVIRRVSSVFQNQTGVGGYSFVALAPLFKNSLQAMLLGTALQVNRTNQLNAQILQLWEPSGYVQDDWRVRQNLTLNLGVRYEVFPPPTERQNRISNFNLTTLKLDTASDANRHFDVATAYGNVSPRLGFALTLPRESVLRGGFGMTFYPSNVQSAVAPNNVPTIFSNTSFFQSISKPLVTPTAIDPSTFATNSSITNVVGNDPHLNTSYIEGFHLELEKKVGANVITMGYVGELGRKLLFQTNANTPSPAGPGTAVPAYRYKTQLPYVVSIQYNTPGASSSYHALTAQVQRRTANGFTLNANYTYARGLTNYVSGSGYNGIVGVSSGTYISNPSYDYGPSDLDVRNRAAASLSYEVPYGKSATGLRAVAVKGWQVNALGYWQAGLPFTVINSVTQGTSNVAYVNLPGVTGDRPNMLRNAKIAHPSLTQAFDITAFKTQTVGTAGNEQRNSIYGPHDRRLDASLFKAFTLYHEARLQFRAECFNILNVANFATPNNNITALNSDGTPAAGTTFGTVSNTNQGEVPRQLQFALKLAF